MRTAVLVATAVAVVAGLAAAAPPRTEARNEGSTAPVELGFTVVDRYPHDKLAFTQGLILRGNTVYESTGLRGRSSVRIADLATGSIRKRADLPPELFGEGLALVGDRLIQLTWTNGVARVYQLPDLELVEEHRYQGQGWGLCYDGADLVMSDGSHRLFFRDPDTFALIRTVDVLERERPVARLNELECVGPHVYANVWGTWKIVRINRRSGRVDATLDASNLLSVMEKQTLSPQAVLNGIAYDESDKTFLLTGKLWPRIHRVRITEGQIE